MIQGEGKSAQTLVFPGTGSTGAGPAAAWDEAAFEALFRLHYSALCGFIYRFVRSRDTAEELVQDVFASMWANRHSLDVRTSVKAYLFRAARNRALNWIEHQGVTRAWAERALADPPESASDLPGSRLEAAELRDRVHRALDVLPARCRLVLRLRYLEQMTHAEVAEAMGISIKGVENQLGRGLKALRAHLAGERP